MENQEIYASFFQLFFLSPNLLSLSESRSALCIVLQLYIEVQPFLWYNYGVSSNLDQFQNPAAVDPTVEQIASFIPEEKMKAEFLARFCREAMTNAYAAGKTELQQKLLSYYADQSIRWIRMTARLITNPNNGHLEAILYGMDISREHAYKERIALAKQENATLLERSR